LSEDSLTAIAIIVSAVLAIIGYVFNSKAARDLERSKVYRQTKLDAYREMNAAITDITYVYESCRQLLTQMKLTKPDDSFAPIIMEYVSHLRDSERSLGTDIADRIIQTHEEFVDEQMQDSENKEDRASEHIFVRYAAVSANILSRRVISQGIKRMEMARANAALVSEEPGTVRTDLQNLISHLTVHWELTSDAIANELKRHQDGLNASEIVSNSRDEELASKIAEATKTMKDDLNKAMVSSWFSFPLKRPQHREQSEHGVSSSVLALSQISIALLIAGYTVIFSVLIAEGFALSSVYWGGVMLILVGGYVAVKSIQRHESSEKRP